MSLILPDAIHSLKNLPRRSDALIPDYGHDSRKIQASFRPASREPVPTRPTRAESIMLLWLLRWRPVGFERPGLFAEGRPGGADAGPGPRRPSRGRARRAPRGR